MCTRTKTSFGCGHTHKTDLPCKSPSLCPGLERFHFEREGDCVSCRQRINSNQKQGKIAVIDRGRIGLGRYGKIIRGKSGGYDDEDSEEERVYGERRGRSTRDKIATGAVEERQRASRLQQERQALRQLRQTQTASASQAPIKYNIVPSQPLRPTLRSYVSAPAKNPAPLFGEITSSTKHIPHQTSHVDRGYSYSRHQTSVQPRSNSRSHNYDTRFAVTYATSTPRPHEHHRSHSSHHHSHNHYHHRTAPAYTSQSRPRHSSNTKSTAHQHHPQSHHSPNIYQLKPHDLIEVVQEIDGPSESESDDDGGNNVLIEERAPGMRVSAQNHHHYQHQAHSGPRPHLKDITPSIVEVDDGMRRGGRRAPGGRDWW